MQTASKIIVAGLVLLSTAAQGSHAYETQQSKETDKKPTKAPALPRSVDLRPQLKKWGLLPKSQGARNTCSVFVTAGALEFALSKDAKRGKPLSVEYLNWASGAVTGRPTDGGFFHDILKGFEKHGACLETDLPYKMQFDARLKPSEGAIEKAKQIQTVGLQVHWINPWKPQPGLTDDHLREIKSVLAKGYPVAAGSSHSRLIVGYRDDAKQPGGGIFLTKDSGAAAYSSITYAFTKEKVGDVFWVETPVTQTSKNP